MMNAPNPRSVGPLAKYAKLRRWVAWRTEIRPGKDKPDKVPYSAPYAQPAKTNDSKTWGTLGEALPAEAKLPKPLGQGGVGIVLSGLEEGRYLGGVDLDTCLDGATGRLKPWAQAIVDRFNSYTEISPSGTGVKTF